MNAKQLYKKHLNLNSPKEWVSPKQMELILYQTALGAIQEALDMNNTSDVEV